MSALHWFVSVGFMQQLFPAVFCFVLLNRNLVFLPAGLWEGFRVDRGELERCVLASPPPPYARIRDLSFITGLIKGLKKMDRQIKSTGD